MTTEIYKTDCMVLMSLYPDKYFDLAIVDPPYGIGMGGSKMRARGKGRSNLYKDFHGADTASPDPEYFKELERISKNRIIWGANHFLNKFDATGSCWIVWDKDNSVSHQADCELAYASFKLAVRKFKFKWNGFLQEDMKNKEKRIHPTQKPVALYSWLLEKYSKPGQKVFDSHLGSASSAIAAHRFGVDFVGCELDDHYFNLALERLKFEKIL
jgi:site-specific DNA-methyltransferase (adenine-specific)